MIRVLIIDGSNEREVGSFDSDIYGEYGATCLAYGLTQAGNTVKLVSKNGKETTYKPFERVARAKTPDSRYKPAGVKKKRILGLF